MNAPRGLIVPAGGGQHLDMGAPGRFAALKLVGHDTNASIMLLNRPGPMNDNERQTLRERYRWEIIGPNPL